MYLKTPSVEMPVQIRFRYVVSVTYVQLYLDKVHDLLADNQYVDKVTSEDGNRGNARYVPSTSLKIRDGEDSNLVTDGTASSTPSVLRSAVKGSDRSAVVGAHVEGLTRHRVSTVNDVLILLKKGAQKKVVASTQGNVSSSRAHTIFTLYVERHKQRECSK